MEFMLKILNRLQRDESGQDLIEYALIAALIALAAVASLKTVGTGVVGALNKVATQLNSALGWERSFTLLHTDCDGRKSVAANYGLCVQAIGRGNCQDQ